MVYVVVEAISCGPDSDWPMYISRLNSSAQNKLGNPMFLTNVTNGFQLKNARICDKLQQMHHLLVTTKQQEDAEKK